MSDTVVERIVVQIDIDTKGLNTNAAAASAAMGEVSTAANTMTGAVVGNVAAQQAAVKKVGEESTKGAIDNLHKVEKEATLLRRLFEFAIVVTGIDEVIKSNDKLKAQAKDVGDAWDKAMKDLGADQGLMNDTMTLILQGLKAGVQQVDDKIKETNNNWENFKKLIGDTASLWQQGTAINATNQSNMILAQNKAVGAIFDSLVALIAGKRAQIKKATETALSGISDAKPPNIQLPDLRGSIVGKDKNGNYIFELADQINAITKPLKDMKQAADDAGNSLQGMANKASSALMQLRGTLGQYGGTGSGSSSSGKKGKQFGLADGQPQVALASFNPMDWISSAGGQSGGSPESGPLGKLVVSILAQLDLLPAGLKKWASDMSALNLKSISGLSDLAASLKQMADGDVAKGAANLKTTLNSLIGITGANYTDSTKRFQTVLASFQELIDTLVKTVPDDPDAMKRKADGLRAMSEGVKDFANNVATLMSAKGSALEGGTNSIMELIGTPEAFTNLFSTLGPIAQSMATLSSTLSSAKDLPNWKTQFAQLGDAFASIRDAMVTLGTIPITENALTNIAVVVQAVTKMQGIPKAFNDFSLELVKAPLDQIPKQMQSLVNAINSIPLVFSAMSGIDGKVRQAPNGLQKALGQQGDVSNIANSAKQIVAQIKDVMATLGSIGGAQGSTTAADQMRDLAASLKTFGASLQEFAGGSVAKGAAALKETLNSLIGISGSNYTDSTKRFQAVLESFRSLIDTLVQTIPNDPEAMQRKADGLRALSEGVKDFAENVASMMSVKGSALEGGSNSIMELMGTPEAFTNLFNTLAPIAQSMSNISNILSSAKDLPNWKTQFQQLGDGFVALGNAISEINKISFGENTIANIAVITQAITKMQDVVTGLQDLGGKIADATVAKLPTQFQSIIQGLAWLGQSFVEMKKIDAVVRNAPTSLDQFLGTKGSIFSTDGVVSAANELAGLSGKIRTDDIKKSMDAMASVATSAQTLVPSATTISNSLAGFKPLYAAMVSSVEAIDNTISPVTAAIRAAAIGISISVLKGLVQGLSTLQNMADLSAAVTATGKTAEQLEQIARNLNRIWNAIGNIFTGQKGAGGDGKTSSQVSNASSTVASLGQTLTAALTSSNDNSSVASAGQKGASLFDTSMQNLVGSAKNAYDGVIGWFAQLSDELVGHSIVPDMVTEIESWFTRLEGSSDIVKSAFRSFTGDVSNTIMQFVRTGKFNFDDFAQSVIKDFDRIAQSQYVNPVIGQLFGTSGIGGFLGNIVTGLLGFSGGGLGLGSAASTITAPKGRALGGPVFAGMPYMVGEDGPEPFVPGISGRILSNGSNGAQPLIVNFNFPPGTDAASFRKSQGQVAAQLTRAVARGQRNL